MDKTYPKATYLFALGQLPSIGIRALQRIALAYQEPWRVLDASEDELTTRLDTHLGRRLRERVDSEWQDVWQRAVEMTERHAAAGVAEIAITDENYPGLLQHIPDAPSILYVKGNADVLRRRNAVAVVGTRNPTSLGITVAQRVARHFAAQQYVVVSGLAQGIDTGGHVGALEANGETIAVFGTPLDTVYPAENKHLAKRICDQGGALVSEYAFGQRTFKSGFVQRDRIQAGLSLAVIVVQTKVDGGTMHTVRFAEQYGRLVFAPQPIDTESSASEYSGIWQLIREKRAHPFQQEDYHDIQSRLLQLKQRLSSEVLTGHIAPDRAAAQLAPNRPRASQRPRERDLWTHLEDAPEPLLDHEQTAPDSRISQIEHMVRHLYPTLTTQQYDDLVKVVRERIFGLP